MTQFPEDIFPTQPSRPPRRGARPLRGLVLFILTLVLVIWGLRTAIGWVASGFGDGQSGASSSLSEALEPEPRTPELSYDGFQAGDIISDDRFFDADAMDQDAIRAFIGEWNTGCREGRDGTPCLAAYREDAPQFAADDLCPGGFNGQAGDDAATIVWRAATGCGINPQVLLTTLQKEQGLITASGRGLTETRYLTAMGYACPDGAACDGDYHGFARQVYFAARQFRMYEARPDQYSYRPGETAQIPYSAEPECGGADVHIANQATADLYNYTPHQPDADALAGVSGLCSSWGNLNFYAYFTAWFGPAH